MRFMIIRKADADTEAGVMPGNDLLSAMARYNQSLIEAGMMLDGMGLHPSDKGARIQFKNGKPVITDGPFAETRELIAGFTLIQAKSKEEALDWVKRWPAEDANGNAYLELRRVYEMEDFAAGDGIEQHQQNAAQLAAQLSTQQLRLNPYLNFNGNCRIAFEFYEKVLGGRIENLMTFGESPMCSEVPKELHHRVIHVRLNLGNAVLMGSDAPPHRFQPNQGIANNLQVPDPAEAERIFNALADNGTIVMPLATTFWARRFGALTDQFGIQWMINCE